VRLDSIRMSQHREYDVYIRSRSPAKAKPDFHVCTRKGASSWADSVLGPSPRKRMEQEVGHITSDERQPILGAKTAAGVKQPPVSVSSTTNALSPRGRFGERNDGQENGGEAATPKEHAAMMRKRAAMMYRQRARVMLAHRERGWDNTSHKATPPMLHGIKPLTVEPWYRDADEMISDPWKSPFHNDSAWQHGRGPVAPEPTPAWKAAHPAFADGHNQPSPDVNQRAASARGAPRSDARGHNESLRRKFAAKSTSNPSPFSNSSSKSAWDSSTFKPTPHALRGTRPITREPWAKDSKVLRIYRGDVIPAQKNNGLNNLANDDLSGLRLDDTTPRGSESSEESGSFRNGSDLQPFDVSDLEGPVPTNSRPSSSPRGSSFRSRSGSSAKQVQVSLNGRNSKRGGGLRSFGMPNFERWWEGLSTAKEL
jgi:hypothetical protein